MEPKKTTPSNKTINYAVYRQEGCRHPLTTINVHLSLALNGMMIDHQIKNVNVLKLGTLSKSFSYIDVYGFNTHTNPVFKETNHLMQCNRAVECALPVGLAVSVVFVMAMHMSPWGNLSQMSISGQGKPNASMMGVQPSRTASHSQRHG